MNAEQSREQLREALLTVLRHAHGPRHALAWLAGKMEHIDPVLITAINTHLERSEPREQAQRNSTPDWSPMLRTADLQFSFYADGTFEIRDGGSIYAHLTPEETSAMLAWIDAREAR